MTGYHWGRSWTGTPLEDVCPCGKGPCGLAADIDPACPEHSWTAAKSMRQCHPADMCEGRHERD